MLTTMVTSEAQVESTAGGSCGSQHYPRCSREASQRKQQKRTLLRPSAGIYIYINQGPRLDIHPCPVLSYARSFTSCLLFVLLRARSPRVVASVDRFFNMHPQRPLPQAMPVPPSLGQTLRDAALGFGRGKNLLGGNIAYGFIQSLKECLYFLLCCWCIKEILD
ncbi:hypothetical protein ACEWY4_019716 [Coilia grayii]|uniref:Lens epithelial cell protein LEP503 n=1 Tax=Coilia grayii TaxID=363190 RepID=A0ABD1JDQ9_9TELE